MRRTLMLCALVLLCSTTGALASTRAGGLGTSSSASTSTEKTSSATGSAMLVGNQQMESSGDSNGSGLAQAFEYTASASGSTSSIDVYVNSGTTATKVSVGVYSNSGGKPGSLLASGSIASPKAGAGNALSVGSASITQGTPFCLCLPRAGGQRNYPDSTGQSGAAASYVESSSGLTSLPANYAPGDEWSASPASFYAMGSSAAAPAAPSNSGVPVVSGSAVEGQTLSTSNGSWSHSPTSFGYQWQDCNSSGGSCANIAGATSASYTLGSGYVGDTVRSVVTAKNSGGSGSASSAVTGVVASSGGGGGGGGGAVPANAVQPYFTASSVSSGGVCSAGCAVVGQQLSVTPGSWSNSPTSFGYQWEDCSTSAGSSTGVQISSSNGTGYWMTLPVTGSCSDASGAGATSSTYTVGSSDVGKALTVVVTARNGSGSASTS